MKMAHYYIRLYFTKCYLKEIATLFSLSLHGLINRFIVLYLHSVYYSLPKPKGIASSEIQLGPSRSISISLVG